MLDNSTKNEKETYVLPRNGENNIDRTYELYGSLNVARKNEVILTIR